MNKPLYDLTSPPVIRAIREYMLNPHSWFRYGSGNLACRIGPDAVISRDPYSDKFRFAVYRNGYATPVYDHGRFVTEEEATPLVIEEVIEQVWRLGRALFAVPSPPAGAAAASPPPRPANDNLDHLQEMLGDRGFKVG